MRDTLLRTLLCEDVAARYAAADAAVRMLAARYAAADAARMFAACEGVCCTIRCCGMIAARYAAADAAV